MKQYKVIALPAVKSVTGKDIYSVVEQRYVVGPDFITVVESLTKEKADAIRNQMKVSYDEFPNP